MQISPRYDSVPIICVATDDLSVPLIRQRRRIETMLASLDEAQWAHPTRCAGWTVQDVVSHLVEVNTFWTYSIRCGLAGEPSRLLAGFDPVASPAKSVAAARDRTSAEVFERFRRKNDALAAAFGDVADWSTLAEAPPGHISISALAHHALWDAWIHERDIAVPLGRATPVEADEVTACLAYAAALGPAFALMRGDARRGTLAVRAEHPDVSLSLTITDAVRVAVGGPDSPDEQVSGDATELTEMLSLRAPFTLPVQQDNRWMFEGLATVFDTELVG